MGSHKRRVNNKTNISSKSLKTGKQKKKTMTPMKYDPQNAMELVESGQ